MVLSATCLPHNVDDQAQSDSRHARCRQRHGVAKPSGTWQRCPAPQSYRNPFLAHGELNPVGKGLEGGPLLSPSEGESL